MHHLGPHHTPMTQAPEAPSKNQDQDHVAHPWPSEGLTPKSTPGTTMPAPKCVPKHISLLAQGARERGQHAVAVLTGPGSRGTWSLSHAW